MMISFSKYSGCGNDFILIDNRCKIFPLENPALIQTLCHRHKGIGADGIVVLEESFSCDFKMRIFNKDGTEAEMCGNGIRCLMKFIQELGLRKPSCKIETMQRQLELSLEGPAVRTRLGPPTDQRWDIQLVLPNKKYELHYLDTGVPHVVHFVDDLEKASFEEIAPQIRQHPLFAPKGTNVNFAQIAGSHKIKIRTFERGVEGETQACGTGASAVAVAALTKRSIMPIIEIEFASGDSLFVDFLKENGHIIDMIQIGPAVGLYKGSFKLSKNHNLLDFNQPEQETGSLCLQS